MRPVPAGLVALLLCLTTTGAPGAGPDWTGPPRPVALISIVIDDIGYRRSDGLRALELPGPLTFAVLPHTPYGPSIARLAWRLGREVLLHLPMESREGHRLGPGGVYSRMGRAEVRRTVGDALRSVPYAVGVSNHMGSLLTAEPEHMDWVMESLGEQPGLFFLDSRTIDYSVAAEAASRHGLDVYRRDVFLDNVRDERLIRRQFHELVRLARARGSALAIGHPYPETVRVLGEMLPQLDGLGVRLVPVSRLRRPARPAEPRTLQASTESEGALR